MMRPINRLADISTIVFDWGNTLMKELPYEGAMLDWPQVEAVPGAVKVLQALKPDYRLVIGTNAVASTASQIEAALERAGLGGLIDQAFTYKEVNSRKPEPRFFDEICLRLGTNPSQMLMVGDSWGVDVNGALQSGWSAAWYNPAFTTCPGLLPLHALEIHHMEDLPGRLADLDLPLPTEAMRWLQEQGTSQTIILHVQMVAALAYQLAEWLAARGQTVNPILAQRGGLLHDLAKLSARRPSASTSHHGELAGRLLYAVQQPELAEIARRHQFYLPEEHAEYEPRTWEEKLVYYVDKMVEGTRFVSLAERLEALNQRYPGEFTRFSAGTPAVLAVESEICAILGVSGSQLFDLLKSALFEELPLFIAQRD